VQTWEQAARDAFLNAYREAARERGLFTAWHEAAGLIDLFLLEKAFDELGNEMDHRPDRLRSALAGIRDLVAASSSGDN